MSWTIFFITKLNMCSCLATVSIYYIDIHTIFIFKYIVKSINSKNNNLESKTLAMKTTLHK
jgi:hypothetical protein